jgi:hypothetical protein
MVEEIENDFLKLNREGAGDAQAGDASIPEINHQEA